jgi:hypothetical protein
MFLTSTPRPAAHRDRGSASSCHQPTMTVSQSSQDVAEGDRPCVAQIVGVTRDPSRESVWGATGSRDRFGPAGGANARVGLARLPVADATRCRANARRIGWDSMQLEAISHGTGHATD